jgi:hypothetical protein
MAFHASREDVGEVRAVPVATYSSIADVLARKGR